MTTKPQPPNARRPQSAPTFRPIARRRALAAVAPLIAATTLAILAASAGCQPDTEAKIAPHDQHQARDKEKKAADRRARLPLSRIRPVPPRPQDAGPVEPLSEVSRRRLARARDNRRAGRYEAALAELEKAFRDQPDHPELHREAALALRAAGRFREMRSHLDSVAEVRGDDVAVHAMLGRLAFEAGRFDDAIREYRIALKAKNLADEKTFAALSHFYLAKSLNAKGYFTAAIKQYRAYEQAVAILTDHDRADPELRAVLEMIGTRAGKPISVAYEKLGQYDQAARALSEAVAQSEPDPGTREHLARLLAKTGRYDEALAQARLLFDDSDRAIGLLADIHAQAGTPSEAVADFRALYERHPDHRTLVLAYVDALDRFNQHEKAQRVLEEAVARHPEWVSIQWRLADRFEKERQWHRVERALAGALRADPGAVDEVAAHVDRLAEIAEAVDALLERDPPPSNPTSAEAPPPPERAADAEIDFASAYIKGLLAERAGRLAAARRDYRRSLQDARSFAPARIRLAELLLAGYAWSEAADLLDQDENALRTSSRLLRLRGRAAAGLDRFEKAEQYFQAALDLNRSDTQAIALLADRYRQTGDFARAIEQYEALLALNPLAETAREALIELYVGQDLIDRSGAVPLLGEQQRRKAAEQLSELKRLSGSPHRIARCAALVERGPAPTREDWTNYRKALLDAVKTHGPDATTFIRIAQSYVFDLDADHVLEFAEKTLALDPENLQALRQKADGHLLKLEYDATCDILAEMLRRHPNRQRWINQLWRLLMVDHQFEKAFALATEQLQRPDIPDDTLIRRRVEAVEALRWLGDHDRRITLIENWRNHQPEEVSLTALLINACIDAGRFDKAISLALAWYQRDRDDDAIAAVRRALLRAERYDQAVQIELDRLARQRRDESVRRQLISLLTAAERYDEAIELLDAYESQASDAITWRDLRRQVLESAGRFDESLELLEDWLREVKASPTATNPNLIHFLQSRIAVDLFLAQRYDTAATRLEKWIEQADQDRVRFNYLRTLSNCLQFKGDNRGAIDALDRAFKLADRDPGVNNDLGYSLADEGLRIAEAERMIRYALIADPQNGAYLDSMGWVLYKRGDFQGAQKWLERGRRAIELSAAGQPSDPVVYDHLGDTRWRLGQKGQAQDMWRKALELVDAQLSLAARRDYTLLREQLTAKIETAKKGEPPAVAPLAQEPDEPKPD